MADLHVVSGEPGHAVRVGEANDAVRAAERDTQVRGAEQPRPESPLMRELLGETLRSARQRQERTLKDVADRAGVSMTYLSEIERGHKEASSEVIAAITRSLGGELVDLLTEMMTRALPVTAPASGSVAIRAVA